MLLVNHALSITAHPRLRDREITERFLAGGCFPLPFNKGNGFICAKRNKEGRNGGDAAAGGQDGARWPRTDCRMCRLGETLRVVLLPSAGVRQDPCPAPPSPSPFGQSQSCKLIYLLFKGFCSVFGFLSISPCSAQRGSAGQGSAGHQHLSAWRLRNNLIYVFRAVDARSWFVFIGIPHPHVSSQALGLQSVGIAEHWLVFCQFKGFSKTNI